MYREIRVQMGLEVSLHTFVTSALDGVSSFIPSVFLLLEMVAGNHGWASDLS
jgi:hypothetical protein